MGLNITAKDSRFKKVSNEGSAQMRRLRIPGIAIGIVSGGKEYYAGLGVASLENKLPITGDTLFQIASISKTFLATALMRLVDAGKIALDVPILKYVPELKLKDRYTTQHVALRHLLTHTGGWHGDYFNDFGGGDEAVEKIVESMRGLPQITPLGTIWSYNNSGFYLAARVLEKLTGKPFETSMKDLVFDPLGLKMTFYSSRDVMTHSFAVGHQMVRNKAQIARPYGQGRATSPAGGIITNLKDLLRYAQFHMGNGKHGKKRIISQARLKEMHNPLFPAAAGRDIALSWFISKSGEYKTLSHSGSINGQQSLLTIIPEKNFAVAVFTNSDHGNEVCAEISKVALREYLHISPARLVPIKASKALLKEYDGQYDMPLMHCKVVAGTNRLILKMTDKGGYPTPSSPPLDQPPPVPVALYAEDKIMGLKSPRKTLRGEFLRGPNGKIQWMRLYSRIFKRIK